MRQDDTYLKVLLTFIAFMQLVICVRLVTAPAQAQDVQRVLVVNEYVPVVGRSGEPVNVRVSSPVQLQGGNEYDPLYVRVRN